MKCLRYVALLLTVAIIIFAFCSCGTSGKTIFENALKAISTPDFEKLSFYVTDGSLEEIYSMREYFSLLDDDKSEAYARLMSNVGVASYYNEANDSDGNITLSLRLKHVDITKLLYDVATEISVSGTPSGEVISNMCSSGRIENYIVYGDVTAELIKTESGLRLKADGESKLSKELEVAILLRWLSLH